MLRYLILSLCLLIALTATGAPIINRDFQSDGGGGGGGGGGAFTFIASVSGAADTSGTDVVTSAGLTIVSGDLLVAVVTHEDDSAASSTVSLTETGGSTYSFTFDAGEEVRTSGDEVNVYPGYLLAASTGGSPSSFTAVVSNARAYKRLIIYQFRPSSGTTSKDISGTREAVDNSGTNQLPTTGTFTTTGSYTVVCAMSGMYTSGTYSDQVIDGVAADEVVQQNSAGMWCSALSSPLSTVDADAVYTATSVWAATAIAFKSS